jgi:hypothetical protein
MRVLVSAETLILVYGWTKVYNEWHDFHPVSIYVSWENFCIFDI